MGTPDWTSRKEQTTPREKEESEEKITEVVLEKAPIEYKRPLKFSSLCGDSNKKIKKK